MLREQLDLVLRVSQTDHSTWTPWRRLEAPTHYPRTLRLREGSISLWLSKRSSRAASKVRFLRCRIKCSTIPTAIPTARGSHLNLALLTRREPLATPLCVHKVEPIRGSRELLDHIRRFATKWDYRSISRV